MIQDIKTKYDLLRKRFRNKNYCLIVHPDINLFDHLIQSFEKPFLKRFDEIQILLSWAGIFLTTFLNGAWVFGDSLLLKKKEYHKVTYLQEKIFTVSGLEYIQRNLITAKFCKQITLRENWVKILLKKDFF